MKRFFSVFRLCVVYLCFVYFLPFTTHAKLTGEIIFPDPLEFRELWIGKINEGHSARRIYRLPLLVMELSVQKGNRYLLVVAESFDENELQLGVDAYLLDRNKRHAGARNLTQVRFGTILDAAISRNGDVVFTNLPFVPIRNGVLQDRGLFLISQEAMWKDPPKAELLKRIDAYQVDWAPHRNQIVYSTDRGIFLFNVLTKKVSQITKEGERPVYSPDGKRIAFFTKTKPTKIGIISLVNPLDLTYIEIKGDVPPHYLTWSLDGQHVVYTLSGRNLTYSNFAVPVVGGPHKRILEMYAGGVPLFEWTHTAYAVEPANKLTTLWGKLKQQDLQ